MHAIWLYSVHCCVPCVRHAKNESSELWPKVNMPRSHPCDQLDNGPRRRKSFARHRYKIIVSTFNPASARRLGAGIWVLLVKVRVDAGPPGVPSCSPDRRTNCRAFEATSMFRNARLQRTMPYFNAAAGA